MKLVGSRSRASIFILVGLATTSTTGIIYRSLTKSSGFSTGADSRVALIQHAIWAAAVAFFVSLLLRNPRHRIATVSVATSLTLSIGFLSVATIGLIPIGASLAGGVAIQSLLPEPPAALDGVVMSIASVLTIASVISGLVLTR